LRVVVPAAVAPGVDVGCSVLRAFEGGEGSVEFVRSWIAICCGFADAARGGLFNVIVRSKHWIFIWRSDCEHTYTDSAFAPSGRSVVI